MGAIDQRASEVLKPLICGESRTINEVQTTPVVAWAALKAVVAEYTDPRSVVITAAERKHIFQTHGAPPGWVVFVGRVVPETPRILNYQHYMLPMLLLRPDPPRTTSMQTSSFVMGELVLFASSTPDAYLASKLQECEMPELVRLWPSPPAGADLDEVEPLAVNDAIGLWTNFVERCGLMPPT
jgi:hypothetical protein